MKRMLELFGHIARIAKMDGDNRKGRLYREWLDNIKEGCQKDIHCLIKIAQEQNKWRQVVKCSLDTYGLSARG